MTTREALKAVADQLTDELVICTTGYTCRDMQASNDRSENFYMIGSMGVAASLGLGVALNLSHRRVVVLDGDGSVLMGLGTLAMVGALKPKNLIHVVLDNEVFASTGNQRTYSNAVALDKVADTCGYPVVQRTQTKAQVTQGWKELRSASGPCFFLMKCKPDLESPMPRIRLEPTEITRRFMESAR